MSDEWAKGPAPTMITAGPPPIAEPLDLDSDVNAVHVLKRSLEGLRRASDDVGPIVHAESILGLLADRLAGLLGVEELPPGKMYGKNGEEPQSRRSGSLTDPTNLDDGEELPNPHDEVKEIIREIKLRDEYITSALTLAALRGEAHPSSPSSKTSPNRTSSSSETSQKGKTPTPASAPAPAAGQRIAKLQSYNAIKDIAQELMGLVAENRGVTVGTLYEGAEFGVTPKD